MLLLILGPWGVTFAADIEDLTEQGRIAFEPCLSCHALDRSTSGMPGPNLAGLIGRPVAGDTGYAYSPVLRAAGDRGLTWTPGRLKQFLADPEAMFPGMWMSYQGIKDEREQESLAGFIAGHK
ncbi:MAG: hypothetical protein ABJN26_09565 [Stappiaceae bacterium]